ncbi:MAG TPA: glycosyltransferase [Thermoleophilaceae bacterium]
MDANVRAYAGVKKRRPNVALVVVTRDRPDLLARYTLPSLERISCEPAEIVIVDQSAGPDTYELVSDLPGVRVLRSAPGLSRGRNLAVAETDSPFIVFTDDDVEFGPGWLERVERLFDEPTVGAVCGRGVDSLGRPLPFKPAGTYRYPASPFGLGHGFNVAFRRAALEQVGPFDERLGAGAPVPAAEDTDMLYRVMKAGWAARCDDGITVRHHSWRSAEQERAAHRNYGVGFAAQTAKHLRKRDLAAARVAASEVAGHLFWLAVSAARGDRSALVLQLSWGQGAFAGARVLRQGLPSVPPPPEPLPLEPSREDGRFRRTMSARQAL